MPQILDLPLVITSRIFQYVIQPSRLDHCCWYRYLPYLQVCREWRYIFMPHLYQYGYYFSLSYRRETPSTNLNLLASLNRSNFIRNLSLQVHDFSGLGKLIYSSNSLFRFGSTDWSKVVEFCISILLKLPVPEKLEMTVDNHIVQVRFLEFVNSITLHMPNIKNLWLDYTDGSTTSINANRKFISAYSKSLTHIRCSYFGSFLESDCFTNLTHLDFELDPEAECLLPKVNCSTIQRIHLHKIPKRFTWRHLIGTEPNREVCFTSLTKLVMRFCTEITDMDLEDQDGNEIENMLNNTRSAHTKYKINFPVLQYLEIDNEPSKQLKNDIYIYSTKLSDVFILSTVNVGNILDNIPIKTVSDVSLGIGEHVINSNDDFYKTTNKLLTGLDKGCNSHLSLPRLGFVIDWNRVTWNGLVMLTMDWCNLTTFINIITCIKSLTVFYIDSFNIEELSREMYGAIPDVIALEYISITGIELGDIDQNMAALFIRYMVLHSVSLKHIFLLDLDWIELENYVNENKDLYPHLGTLRVNM